MSENPIQVDLRRVSQGSIMARADVTLETAEGPLTILDFPVISRNGESPWVVLPTASYQKNGKTINKQVLDMRPGLLRRIKEAVLSEFHRVAQTDKE